MSNVTWRELLQQAFDSHGDSFAQIESSTMTDAQMDTKFDNGYGAPEGCEFTVWTVRRVYFPTEYDGAEGVASVSRNPDGKATQHSGD